jgi:predicted transcriptional regulator
VKKIDMKITGSKREMQQKIEIQKGLRSAEEGRLKTSRIENKVKENSIKDPNQERTDLPRTRLES